MKQETIKLEVIDFQWIDGELVHVTVIDEMGTKWTGTLEKDEIQ